MLTITIDIILTKVLWFLEDNLCWKTTLSGRQPLVEDDLLWKTTFVERQSSVEDNLWWRTTFGSLKWKTTFGGSLHAAYSAFRHFWK